MADYQVLTTTMAGAPYAEIANAAIESITWELNGWGEFMFSLAVTDPQAWAELRPDYQTKREIQVWRNGRLIWWGVYVAGDADQDRVTFTAYGLLWYFGQRFFGPVHSNAMPKILNNGNMEVSPVTTGWTVSSGATVSASTSLRRSGTQAMKIVTSSAAGVEHFVFQSVGIPLPSRSRPLTFFASAWLYVESITRPHVIDNAIGIGPGGSPSNLSARVKPDDPFGEWKYFETQYVNPALATTALSCVLYAPAAGTVYWDDARVTHEERTGGIAGNDWSDDYLRRLFNYGAGNSGGGSTGPGGSAGDQTQWWGAFVLKSSLNMTWTGAAGAAGSLRTDTYWDHADEGNILTAMLELPARNIVDMEITWPAAGRSRSLTSWVPRKGTTKNGLAAEQGRNIVNWRYAVDGRRRVNDVRVSARSPGAVREVGQAGGPTVAVAPQLETIISPPQEITGSLLAETATTELARLTEPLRTPTITVAAGPYMGDIQPGGTAEAGSPITVGDSIPVRINHGWVVEDATRRVVKMTLRPQTETLDLIFNVA